MVSHVVKHILTVYIVGFDLWVTVYIDILAVHVDSIMVGYLWFLTTVNSSIIFPQKETNIFRFLKFLFYFSRIS